MIRLAFIASLLFAGAVTLPAQQKDTQQQDKQQNQQSDQKSQQQSDQNQQDSDSLPVPSESSSKKPRTDTDNDKGGKNATSDEPPALSSDAEMAKAAATYNPLPAQQDVEVGMFYLHKGDIDAAIDRFLDAIQQR